MKFASGGSEPTSPGVTRQESFAPTRHGRLWVLSLTPAAPSGLPLVIVHGGPGISSDYLHSLGVLADERRVVFYDQIGVGRSERANDPSAWTVDAYVEHLEAVREHLGLDRFHLLGQSWGGFLALAYADVHAEHVASIILSSPLIDTDRWLGDAHALIAELPPMYRASIEAGPEDAGYEAAQAEYYRRHFCHLDPWPPVLQQGMDEMDADSYNAMWGPNEFTCAGVLAHDSRAAAIERLGVRNLWLTGTDDEARPQTIAGFAAMSPASKLVILPGTHCVHLEQPQAYESALREFLNAAQPGATLSA